MSETQQLNSNFSNSPITSQQEVYGNFLAKNSLDKMAFIDQESSDKYESAKTNKRKKLALFSTVATAALAVVGLVISPRFLPPKIGARIEKAVHDRAKHIGERAMKNPKLNKFIEKCQTKAQKFLSHFNILNNASTVKDAVLRQKLYNHVAPLRWIDRKSADLYYRTSSSMCKKSFDRAFKAFGTMDDEVVTALKKIKPERLDQVITIGDQTGTVRSFVEKARGLLGQMDDILKTSYGQGAQEKSRRKIYETLDNLDDPFWKEFTKILKSKKKSEYKRLFDNFIAEEMIQADKTRLAQEFGAEALRITDKGGMGSKVQEILEAILDKDTMQKRITPLTKRANKSLNKALDVHTNIFVDKMRDVCVSTAASDIYGILGLTVALVLGLYTAQAKTKEERTSVALTTGVPLGLGIIGTTIATLKMVSGFKALGVGFATTLISGVIGDILDRAHRKKHGIGEIDLPVPTMTLPVDTNIENYIENAKK